MMELYKGQPTVPTEWPPRVGDDFFGRLGLLETQNQYATGETLQQKAWYATRGEIDKIPQVTQDKLIDIDDVLKPTDTGQSLIVVVDGPPGIGKTTLCRKLLNMWANGKLIYDQYNLVLYCPLRNGKVAQAKTLADLSVYKSPTVSKVVEWMTATEGENLLIIFDGWDELGTKFRKVSLAAQIIRRELLARCSVIVTSRTYASSSLLELESISRHVEVLGFSQEITKTVILGTLKKEINVAEKLIKDLEIRDDVLSLCYIPLICSIVILIYRRNGELPNTLTNLYYNFILETIRRHVKHYYNIEQPAADVKSLETLPECIAEPFREMCKLSYLSLKETNPKMTFNIQDIVIKENFLGLMTTFNNFGEVTCQFLHLSIQEFLAAWWIVRHENTAKILEDYLKHDHFRVCLRFVAGLTHLEHPSYKQYFNKELCLYPKSAPASKFSRMYQFNLHQAKQRTETSTKQNHHEISKFDMLLLYFLYESQNTSLCQVLAQAFYDSSLSLKVALHKDGDQFLPRVSPFDMLCISYFLNNSNITWKQLNLLDLDEQKVRILSNTLISKQIQCHSLQARCRCESVILFHLPFFHHLEEVHLDLNDSQNFISLMVVLIKLCHLKVLTLSSSLASDKCSDQNQLPKLEDCLQTNSTLQYMALTSRSPPCITSVLNGITRNKTITSLSLSMDTNSSNEEKLASGLIERLLKDNHTLQALQLKITDKHLPTINIVEANTPLTALKIGDQTIELIKIVRHLRKLHCLEIDNFCPPIAVFQAQPNIQRLFLRLTHTQMSELFNILCRNTTLEALLVEVWCKSEDYKSNEFEIMGADLQYMLQCNQTLKYLDINYKNVIFGMVPYPCKFLPTSTLSCLKNGLLDNTSLQKLRIQIPLSDANREQIYQLFSIMSKKHKLTEFDLTFKLDRSDYKSFNDEYQSKRMELFYEHGLPLIIHLLESHKTIKHFKICFTIIIRCPYEPHWLERINTFLQTIFDHPSLEYISIPTEILPQEKIEECLQQRRNPLPIINMYRAYQPVFFKYLYE